MTEAQKLLLEQFKKEFPGKEIAIIPFWLWNYLFWITPLHHQLIFYYPDIFEGENNISEDTIEWVKRFNRINSKPQLWFLKIVPEKDIDNWHCGKILSFQEELPDKTRKICFEKTNSFPLVLAESNLEK